MTASSVVMLSNCRRSAIDYCCSSGAAGAGKSSRCLGGGRGSTISGCGVIASHGAAARMGCAQIQLISSPSDPFRARCR